MFHSKAEQRIYFANHQSHADLILIAALFELRSITRPIAAANTGTKNGSPAVFNAIYVDCTKTSDVTRWSPP
jgi:hypothetical protein